MKEAKDLLWFKMDIEAVLKDYEVKHRFYDDGDFGSLTQIEFNSKEKGGNVDFWGLGWLGVFLWDYQKEEEIMNILLEPNKVEEQKKLLIELKSFL
ncbi:hypothetical protein D0809_23605 [Flavobacterium circumlabens]|uniref:Uncharacterized protein n=1 Tax=Flavobacterium circumlabens TaxID=2133765 RepID=A0A4Y7U6C5_9FLAO|nr:hypothetical protein [Flavobacterium circumlabens]TCN50532.1 hypothetical protein EV142_1159 [Flavobacterium circumlabens]TEB41784.1 hypothetical protein D0809_23605 [Flavobacterium circumlabens]